MQKIDYRIVIGLFLTSLMGAIYTFLNLGDNYIAVAVVSILSIITGVISVIKVREIFHYAKEDIDFLDEGSISRFYKYQEIQIKLLKEVLDTFNKKLDGLTQENVKTLQGIEKSSGELKEKIVVQNDLEVRYLEELNNSIRALTDIYQNSTKNINESRVAFQDKIALEIRELNSVITFAQNALVEELKKSHDATDVMVSNITEKIDSVVLEISKVAEETSNMSSDKLMDLKEDLNKVFDEQDKIVEKINQTVAENGEKTKASIDEAVKVIEENNNKLGNINEELMETIKVVSEENTLNIISEIEDLDKKIENNKEDFSLLTTQIDDYHEKIKEQINNFKDSNEDEKVLDEIKGIFEENKNQIVEEIGSIHNRFTENEDKINEDMKSIEESINTRIGTCEENIYELIDTTEGSIKNELDKIKEQNEEVSNKTIDSLKIEIGDVKEANSLIAEENKNELSKLKEEITDSNSLLINEVAEIQSKLENNNDNIAEEIDKVSDKVVEVKEELASTNNMILEANNSLEETKNSLNETKNVLDETKNIVTETKSEVTNTKNCIDETKQEIENINTSVNEVKEIVLDDSNIVDKINEVKEDINSSNNTISEVKEALNINNDSIDEIKGIVSNSNESINEVTEKINENNKFAQEIKETLSDNTETLLNMKEEIFNKDDLVKVTIEGIKEKLENVMNDGINGLEDKLISTMNEEKTPVSYEELAEELDKVIEVINSNNNNLNMEMEKIIQNQSETSDGIKNGLSNANETIGLAVGSINNSNSNIFKELISNFEHWKESEKEYLYTGLNRVQIAIEGKIVEILKELRQLNKQEQEAIISTLKAIVKDIDINKDEFIEEEDNNVADTHEITQTSIPEVAATTKEEEEIPSEEVRGLTKVVDTEKKVVSDVGYLDNMIRNVKNVKQEYDPSKKKGLTKALSATRKMAPIVVVEEDGLIKEFAGDKIIKITNKEQNSVTEFIYDVNNGNVMENNTKINGELSMKMEFNADGTLKRGLEYNKGKIAKEYLYYRSGQLSKRIEYKYTLGVLIRTITTDYDEEGNIVSEN